MTRRAFVDFTIGCGKALLVLSPLILAVLLMLPDGSCRGDCAVGILMLLLVFLPFIGAFLVLIVLPLIIFVVVRWTRQRPIQRFAAFSLVPLVIGVFMAFRLALGAYAMGQMNEEYLERSVASPIGRIETLVLAGRVGPCREECYDILVNGIANSFSNGSVDRANNSIIVKSENRLAELSECQEQFAAPESSLIILQSEGIFDVCVIERTISNRQSGILIGDDRERVVRDYGPHFAVVAQPLSSGKVGPEIVRWEYGYMPYSGARVGAPFDTGGFIRALTGIATDRMGELKNLTIKQRLERIRSAAGQAPLDLYAVFRFLGKAPGIQHSLEPRDAEELKSIGRSICEASPQVRRQLNSEPDFIDCGLAYNRLVTQTFPDMSEKLKLPL